MRYLATILITLLLAVPAMSVELFRYRGAAKDVGTLEYVFEAERGSPVEERLFCFFFLSKVEIQNRCTSYPSKLQKYHILC